MHERSSSEIQANMCTQSAAVTATVIAADRHNLNRTDRDFKTADADSSELMAYVAPTCNNTRSRK